MLFCQQYKDPDVVEEIKEVTSNSLHHAFDTISTEDTQKLTVQALAPGPGKIIVILDESQAAQELRPDVKIQCTYPEGSLFYFILFTNDFSSITLLITRPKRHLDLHLARLVFPLLCTRLLGSFSRRPSPYGRFSQGSSWLRQRRIDQT